ncbi:expressed unknown protein [Seminavis robusta]|uniref:Uncharacterized protein n=1 Tax=Seminavis robusta TaxID=568900 RepID=A0A9N8E603_9STRA|nr:expressed unknown protein [Seminavis robusta]|eukprot:Sro708_g190750.1 n/a (713) ;mRNA; f:36139-38277
MSNIGNKRTQDGGEAPAKKKSKADPQAAARAKLESYFKMLSGSIEDINNRGIGVPHEHFPFHDALSILQRFPSLAEEAFQGSGAPNSRGAIVPRSPLSFFLEAQSDLNTVQTICELAHDHFQKQEHQFKGVLDACKYGAQEGVLEFLLERYPGGAETEIMVEQDPPRSPLMGRDYEIPLDFVLEPHRTVENQVISKSVQRSEEEKIRLMLLLLRAYPRCAEFDKTRRFRKPPFRKSKPLWLRCLNGNFGLAPMHVFFGYFARELDSKACPSPRAPLDIGKISVGLDQAVALSLILPKLKGLWLDAQSYSREALLYLFQEIEKNKSVRELHWNVLQCPGFRESDDAIICAFKAAFCGNSGLERVCFSRYRDSHGLDRNVLEIEDESNRKTLEVITAIATNEKSRIKDIGLEGCRFVGASSTVLAQLLAASQLTSLKIDSCEFGSDWVDVPVSPACTIAKLTVRGCDLASDFGQGLVSQLANLPALRELWLDGPQLDIDHDGAPADLADKLVPLLEKHQLRRLRLRNICVDLTSFEAYLKADDVLEDLWMDPWYHVSTALLDGERFHGFLDCNRSVISCIRKSLQSGNLTLKKVMTMTTLDAWWDNGRVDVEERYIAVNDLAKIEYYQTVNRFGLRQASRCNVEQEEIVGLLCDVASSNYEKQETDLTTLLYRKEGPVFDQARCKHNIQYGLLRSNPMAWCLDKETYLSTIGLA